MSTLRDPDSDEMRDLCSLADDVVSDGGQWLDTPNDQLGGKKPRELLGTPSEMRVRELLLSIKYGIPT